MHNEQVKRVRSPLAAGRLGSSRLPSVTVFSAHPRSLPRLLTPPQGILGKYDDDGGTTLKGRTTLTLDASGSVDEAKEKKLAAIKARLAASQAGGSGAAQHDLSAVGAAPRTIDAGEDYMSREEAKQVDATFRKSSKKKDGEAKGTRLRRDLNPCLACGKLR